MKIKCEYCGAMIEDTEAKCPNCGAANVNVKRTTVTTPRTIEQLQSWYVARNLPPYEVTRFFIGENHQGPKAFGIYRDGNEFVVYKNKADGSRAIRYRGTDEAYAVNELYLKLKSEILNQKANQGSKGSRSNSSSGNPFWTFFTLWLTVPFTVVACMVGRVKPTTALLVLVSFVIVYNILSHIIGARIVAKNGERPEDFDTNHPKLSKWLLKNPLDFFKFKRPTILAIVFLLVVAIIVGRVYNRPHYYNVNNTTYVSYHDDWYYYSYDDYTSINHDALPVELQSHPADYEYSWNNTSGWNSSVTRFEDSDTYKDNYGSDYGWSSDSDYDWDSGSDWDSGGSDWDSDW